MKPLESSRLKLKIEELFVKENTYVVSSKQKHFESHPNHYFCSIQLSLI